MDPTFEKREYYFERFGWLCMFGVIVAACLGLIGKGPFSSRTLKTPTLNMQYHRFLHYGDLTKLEIEVETQDPEFKLSIPNRYLKGFRIVQIVPEPVSMTNGPETAFQFHNNKHEGLVSIVFHLDPENIGTMHGTIRIDHGKPETFTQFVYP